MFVFPRSAWWREFMLTVNANSYECLRVFLQLKYQATLVSDSAVLILSFPDEDTKIQFQLTYVSP
jgi:hypothetical protein